MEKSWKFVGKNVYEPCIQKFVLYFQVFKKKKITLFVQTVILHQKIQQHIFATFDKKKD